MGEEREEEMVLWSSFSPLCWERSSLLLRRTILMDSSRVPKVEYQRKTSGCLLCTLLKTSSLYFPVIFFKFSTNRNSSRGVCWTHKKLSSSSVFKSASWSPACEGLICWAAAVCATEWRSTKHSGLLHVKVSAQLLCLSGVNVWQLTSSHAQTAGDRPWRSCSLYSHRLMHNAEWSLLNNSGTQNVLLSSVGEVHLASGVPPQVGKEH